MPFAEEVDEIECGAVVVGSGACGLMTAVTAAHHGIDVKVIEKADEIGGCSAYSFGMLWMPCNPVAARHGIADDRDAALTYLADEMGRHFDPDAFLDYLDHGPRVLDFMERHCGIVLVPRKDFPDYRPDKAGALHEGRALIPLPYDGRRLGPLLQRLRAPQKTLFGMTFTPAENKLISSRSPAGVAYLARRYARHVGDLVRHGRSTFLTGGNALVAQLLKAAADRQVPIHTGVAMRSLWRSADRIAGVIVDTPHGPRRIRSREGVVLACGGYPHDVSRCEQWFSRPLTDGQSWGLAPDSCRGDGVRAALDAGAHAARDVINDGFWAPVSRVRDHGFVLSGHFRDRFSPGYIAVTPDGRRFANEADSNHHFAEALLRATPPGGEPVAWLICDRQSFALTGMGEAIHGKPFPFGKHLRSGYLVRRDSISALAAAIDVPADALMQSIARNNDAARTGVDIEFGKGDSLFNRYFCGGRGPNPCLGAIEEPPFYAVRFSVGHMATLSGIETDRVGRALDAAGAPIDGLYVSGNDRVNLFRGACPGGGITLGPGLTWAHLTGLALAGIAPMTRDIDRDVSARCP
ncbi:FAD-dependent oxidoreductase [Burkholderia sp. Bp8963]|uniref:FAD-dependent oxidoreductase n=1 Tax=Burkholderia sp. Bp8963 TaxID=2184547 RepID=UPI00163A98B6|nr:FAD-dependent oxidoreductase [Burkholderia sp. Bp8963]